MSDYPGAPLGIRIRRFRQAAGMSLAQLARKSGVAKSTIHTTEQDKTSPTYQTIVKLGMALGVRPAALTDGLYDIEDDIRKLKEQYGGWL